MPQTVLLADDNIAVQKLVEVTLQKEGYEVVTSDNGLSALDLALKETPGLILADYSLEGLDVHSFIKKTRQKARLKCVPIVLLVNSTDQYDASQLKSAGVQGFIEKPIDSKSLVERVGQGIAPTEGGVAGSDAIASETEDDLSKEEEMKIEELLGWTHSGNKGKGTEEKSVLEDGGGISSGSQGVSPIDQTAESSLEETQYFQPPPIAGEPGDEKGSEVDDSSADGVHQLDQLHDEPSLSTVMSEITSEAEAEYPGEEGAQKDLGNDIQDALKKVLDEKLPGMVKSSLSSESVSAIIEKVVWDVVPSLAEIEIKREIKRLQADGG